MKRRFEIVASARFDLAEIRAYVQQDAGHRTAAAVSARLRERIAFIRDHPLACAARPDLGESMRAAVSQRWIVYYEVTANLTQVIRVLDGAQDAARVLRPDEPSL